MVNNSNGQTFNLKKYHKISNLYNCLDFINCQKTGKIDKNQKYLKKTFISKYLIFS